MLHSGSVSWLVWSTSPGAWLWISVRSFLLRLAREKQGLPLSTRTQLLALCNQRELQGRERCPLGSTELRNQVWAPQEFGRFVVQ